MRTGLGDWLGRIFNEPVDHPHNAYLELLIDTGIIGFCCVVPIFWIMLRRSMSLFLDRSDPIFEAAGGCASALILALLFAGFAAQTFFPREGEAGMWAAVGVALRVWVEREHQRLSLSSEAGLSHLGAEEEKPFPQLV